MTACNDSGLETHTLNAAQGQEDKGESSAQAMMASGPPETEEPPTIPDSVRRSSLDSSRLLASPTEASFKPGGPSEHRPPIKTYGKQWTWDPEIKDYTQTQNGMTLVYTEYQRSGGDAAASARTGRPQGDAQSSASPKQSRSEAEQDQDGYSATDDDTVEDGDGYVKVPAVKSETVTPDKAYKAALDPRFTTVAKPKRFFSVGRIFKTVWFEPCGKDQAGRAADLEWRADCPLFHDEKPCARFRYFVVVRKRLHHSLCFAITTYTPPKGSAAAGTGTNNSVKNRGGRAQDSVVLHSSNVEPPAPYEDEGITRDPVAVIIEDEDQYISPLARLDCARIYTVEDSLRVMKIGRVHMASLPWLEEYYRESVA